MQIIVGEARLGVRRRRQKQQLILLFIRSFCSSRPFSSSSLRFCRMLQHQKLNQQVIKKFPHLREYKAYKVPPAFVAVDRLKCQLSVAIFSCKLHEYYSEAQLRQLWPGGEESASYGQQQQQHGQSQGFFQPLDCNG